MMIVNFIGHGFQWVREHEQNPASFPIGVNTVIRLYVDAGVLYGAEKTPSIITDERKGMMGNIFAHFEHGQKCPELLLIKDGGTWSDITAGNQYSYKKGVQIPRIDGHKVRIREFELAPHKDPDASHKDTDALREFALSPEENNQIFSLSWLAANIRAIMKQRADIACQAPPAETDEIILRWLVCRQALEAANPDNIPEQLNDLLEEPGRFDELVR